MYGKKGDTWVKHDEQPPKVKIDKIPLLKPAFGKDDTVAVINVSFISDLCIGGGEVTSIAIEVCI